MSSKDTIISQILFIWHLLWEDTCRLCPGVPRAACASQGTLQIEPKSLNTSAVPSWHPSSWRSAAMTGPATEAGDLAATFKSCFKRVGNTAVTGSSWFCDLLDDFCLDRNEEKFWIPMYQTNCSRYVLVFPWALPSSRSKAEPSQEELWWWLSGKVSSLLSSLTTSSSPLGPSPPSQSLSLQVGHLHGWVSCPNASFAPASALPADVTLPRRKAAARPSAAACPQPRALGMHSGRLCLLPTAQVLEETETPVQPDTGMSHLLKCLITCPYKGRYRKTWAAWAWGESTQATSQKKRRKKQKRKILKSSSLAKLCLSGSWSQRNKPIFSVGRRRWVWHREEAVNCLQEDRQMKFFSNPERGEQTAEMETCRLCKRGWKMRTIHRRWPGKARR